MYVGGYYLTSAYGAMSLIKNFQETQATRVLSSETRDTLRQWHQRRTTQRSAPSVDDFQVSASTPQPSTHRQLYRANSSIVGNSVDL